MNSFIPRWRPRSRRQPNQRGRWTERMRKATSIGTTSITPHARASIALARASTSGLAHDETCFAIARE
eukprot:1323167-Prymnesium_polylepis.1